MFKNAVQLFEIFGFKLKVDPSWLLIAALIVGACRRRIFRRPCRDGQARFTQRWGSLRCLACLLR